MVKSPRKRRFTLYRLWDARNDLLYVGKCINGLDRIPDHMNEKPWWDEVTHATFEKSFQSDEELIAAETVAIEVEKPKYNKTGKRYRQEKWKAKQQAVERERAERAERVTRGRAERAERVTRGRAERAERAERERAAQEEARQQATRDRAKDHRTKIEKLDDMAADPNASESERTKAAAMSEKLRASLRASSEKDSGSQTRKNKIGGGWDKQWDRGWREWMEKERQAQRDYDPGMYEQYAQERRGHDQPEQTWGPTYTARQQEAWDRERESLQRAQKADHPNWVYPKQADILENTRRPPAQDDGWWSPP